MSPITPPLAPTQAPDPAPAASTLYPGRQLLTHVSQPSQQIGIPPPPPEPLDFDSNPDVIALKAAISVLQVQKSRATGDIQTLHRVREEALNEPEAFIRDLAAEKVRPRDDSLFEASDSDDEGKQRKPGRPCQEPHGKPRAWSSLPKPQDVVRCPPINWAQYAVVGESLDKLHAEQVHRPSQGSPAVFGSAGLYEVKNEGKQEKYPGVAAPYTPGKDIIDRDSKSKR